MIKFISGIVFLILITTIVVVINPELHKPVAISGSNFVIENNTTTVSDNLNVVNKESVVGRNNISSQNVENIKTKESQKVSNADNIKKLDNILTTNSDADARLEKLIKMQEKQRQERVSARKEAERAQKLAEEQLKKAQQQAERAKVVQKQKTVSTPKPVEKKVKQPQQKVSTPKVETTPVQKPKVEPPKPTTPPKKLTEYEETVVWNTWRANVCNTVVSNLDKQFAYIIPAGTTYSYSFDVDNKKQISNINVRISKGYVNPTTHQGIFMIQQSIKSINLTGVLTFPANTERTSVKVSSAIEKTSAQSNNLNSSSFNDIEKIKKQRYE